MKHSTLLLFSILWVGISHAQYQAETVQLNKYSLTTTAHALVGTGLDKEKAAITRTPTAEREIIELWPKKVPGEEKAKGKPVISDDRKGDVTRIAEVTNPVLEIFEAEKPNGAAVIVCPGGGYNILAIDKEGYEVAEWLSKLGYTAFVLQYRVPKKQEGALQDIQRSIRLVRQNASRWGLDVEKIGVLGFSAGGSLAARASTRYEEETYKPVDKADNLSARPTFALLIYPGGLDSGPNKSLTPEIKVTPDTPHMFIFATADDKHSNSSIVIGQALMENMVPVELHILPRGGHGYGLRTGQAAPELWPILAEKWLVDAVKCTCELD